MRIKIKIIIDEKQNIAVTGQTQDRIALPGQPQLRLDERDVLEIEQGASPTSAGSAYATTILSGLPLLVCQKGNRLGKNRGASASSNTQDQPCLTLDARLRDAIRNGIAWCWVFHHSFVLASPVLVLG